MSVITKRVVMLAACLLLASAVSASAQYRHGVVVPRIQVYSPVYDPLWGPWYPYPYAYAYPYDSPAASVRTDVTPKDAEVYVDGYYAGRADDFDGAFKQLHVAFGITKLAKTMLRPPSLCSDRRTEISVP